MDTPVCACLGQCQRNVCTGIESEKRAIRQYKAYMEMIKDEYVSAVLARIVKNEEYHMMVLEEV